MKNIKNIILNKIIIESIEFEKEILNEFTFGKLFQTARGFFKKEEDDIGVPLTKGMERIQNLYNIFNRRLRSLMTKSGKSDDQQEFSQAIFEINKALDPIARRLLPLFKKMAISRGEKFEDISDQALMSLIVQLFINKVFGFEPLIKVSSATSKTTSPISFIPGKEIEFTKSFFNIAADKITINQLARVDDQDIQKEFPEYNYTFFINDNQFVFSLNDFKDEQTKTIFSFVRAFPKPKIKVTVELTDKTEQVVDVKEDNFYFKIVSVSDLK
jgi:hypothetical protein